MIEFTNIQSLMPALNSAVGSYFWKTVFVILATIPAWILTTAIKDWWTLKRQREELVKDSILSIDTYYEINGHRGFLKTIGSRLLKLEEPNHTTHNIPIKLAIEGTITKLHYKAEQESDNDVSDDPDTSSLTTSELKQIVKEVIKQ